jgi:hypothetical protein
MSWGCLAATRALLEGRRSFFQRGSRLAFQAQFQHLLGQDRTKIDDQVLQFTEFGAPPRPGRPPDAVREVFGNALDVGTDFFYLVTPFLVACHPWPPLDVTAKPRTSLTGELTMPAS